MCQRVCQRIRSANKHPLARARKTQVLISVVSWPCAIAAIFTSRQGPQACIQLIAIMVSSTMPIFMLFGYRKSGSQSYSLLEIAIDGLVALLLIGVYISGMILLATQRISEWESPWDYKIAYGLPQVYSNLSCIILGLLYLRTFSQGFFQKCIMPMLEAHPVTYTLCPACDQSVDVLMTKSQDVTMSAAEQENPFGSTDSLRGLYSDDVGSQLLLPESPLDMEGKQTTGIVSNS
ncbi:hypothetical protein N7447_007636 [Penicillium robsamsonii]|uniref:uncharacterized protein n=1 Tax=Penicillium robsamsonii TaxID=1792511 RepID=UPI00254868BF|nr:uncharacterized protein N7447_007636 [Penicillium robsamsonii]KAJ5817628.1 hypothetical protein N7447_007636 [Penicillium robsamsonii]